MLPGGNMKILIIDDEPRIRSLLSKCLLRRGHQVNTAEDGQEGWETYYHAASPYDLVLVDMKMPILDGAGFLRKLRQSDLLTPVIVMTGHAGDEEDGLAPGATARLAKPFSLKALGEIIEHIDLL
jgi:CheY-like chemotaxis protein